MENKHISMRAFTTMIVMLKIIHSGPFSSIVDPTDRKHYAKIFTNKFTVTKIYIQIIFSGAQSLKVLSNEEVAMYMRLGDISADIIFPSCAASVRTGAPVGCDQILQVLSYDAVNR